MHIRPDTSIPSIYDSEKFIIELSYPFAFIHHQSQSPSLFFSIPSFCHKRSSSFKCILGLVHLIPSIYDSEKVIIELSYPFAFIHHHHQSQSLSLFFSIPSFSQKRSSFKCILGLVHLILFHICQWKSHHPVKLSLRFHSSSSSKPKPFTFLFIPSFSQKRSFKCILGLVH